MWKRDSILVAILLLLGALAYANTLQVPFYFDDKKNIEESLALRVRDFSAATLGEAVGEAHLPSRPVANLTFALNYYFHGEEVAGYHLVNLAVHVLTAVMLFLLFRLTLILAAGGKRISRDHAVRIAFFAALIWLVHPVQTQSVTYIVQRMNSLAALFYVSALYSYIQGRLARRRSMSRVWFGLCAAAGLLALGSKENAATLPIFILLYEWYFFQDLKAGWLKRGPLAWGPAVGVLAGLALLYLGPEPLKTIISGYAAREFTLSERLLTEARVVVFYLSLLCYPLPGRMNLEHDFPLSGTLFDPVSTLPALLFIAALASAGVLAARRRRLLSFAIFWFLGNLVIESTVIPLELAFEHRLYLPAMFPVLLPVAAVHRPVRKEWLATGLLGGLVLVLALFTFHRNSLWRDPVRFWEDSLAKSPASARVHNNLGLAYHERGQLEKAAGLFRQALLLRPDYALAMVNLGLTRLHQGKRTEAAVQFRRALSFAPKMAEAHNNLGSLLAERGELRGGLAHLRRAVTLRPAYPVAHNNLGNVLQLLGRDREAARHYAEALRLDPDYETARYNLEIVLRRSRGFPPGE